MIEAIVQITRRVIGDGSIENFLPTLIDFNTRTVSVLEGLPADADTRPAIRDWLAKRDLVTYGIAFRIDDCIHIAAISPAAKTFARLSRTDGEWRTSETSENPLWPTAG